MNATDTRPAPQPTEPWTASRVFRIALAVVLGVITALVVSSALLALVLGPGGEVRSELGGVVDEQVVVGSDVRRG
jgi:hypothetical protein